jgi:hypothetical protein
MQCLRRFARISIVSMVVHGVPTTMAENASTDITALFVLPQHTMLLIAFGRKW